MNLRHRLYFLLSFYLLINLCNQEVLGQNFHSYFYTSPSCNITGTGEPSGNEIVNYNIDTGKPISISYPIYQLVETWCCTTYDYDMNCIGTIYICSDYYLIGYQEYQLPDVDCYSSNCSTSSDIYLSWEPTNLTMSGSPSGTYCANETITISAPNVYHSYVWQYSTQIGIWNTIAISPNSSLTLSIQDIFGDDYESHFYEEIFFRYSIEGCSPLSETRSFSFNPIKPEVVASIQILPHCKDYTDAIINITSISRDILNGETLTYTVYTTSNVFVAQISSTQQPSAGSPVEVRGDISTVAPFGISSGNYKILIESNLSLCGPENYYAVPIINNPTQVTFTNNTPVQPSCYGGNNGSITVTAAGGTGPYEYSKDDGTNFQAPNILAGLTVGNYILKIKDSKGCLSESSPVSIGQPPDITLSSASVTSDYNGRDISCAGSINGQITVSSSGGTGALTYSKDGGTYQASNIFNGLGEGNYTLSVKDANGCTKSSSSVPIVAPPVITGTVTPAPASCNGVTDGKINVTSASGGTGTLSYSRDGTNFQLTTEFSGLAANSYTVTIKDVNGCTITRNATVVQPGVISVSSTPTLITCSGGNDGTVKITATNTVGVSTYSLNGSAFQTSDTFTGLIANAYTLAVKDGNGCIGNGNVTITSNPIITGGITSTAISCNGGTNGALDLTPGGGVGPYTMSWSTGATTEDITGLGAGTYTVTITDSKLCQQSFNRTLTQPLAIAVNPTLSDYNGRGVRCFGDNNGSISTAPTGGNGGYTYSWSNGALTQNINTLIAGNYTVTVTDSKSCTGNQTITITQPAVLATTVNAQNILCFGGNTGSITLNTTGGTTDYEYSINGGTNWQSNPSFTGLTATSYTILTRDENNCSDTDNTTLTSPANLVLIAGNTNTTCNQNNGTANASATGGVTNYTFNWYNSSNTNIGTGNTINNLAAGIYRVEVIDQNSCTKQQNVTISSSDGPSITTTSITGTTCSNTTDGTATINITQGQAPYTIHWPNNQTTETATNLAGGDYIVEVRDNTNCLTLQTVTVPAPPELILQTITQQNPNCNNSADGQITVNAQGGNGTYNYSWNTGSTSNALTNLTAGTYTVAAKDVKNCQTIQQYTLTNPPIFTIDLGADQSICEGQTINKSSSVDNAIYAWIGPDNFTNTQQQVSISEPGTYTLTVTNQNGCEATDSFTLTINTDLLKADFLMVSEAFAGDTVIVIDISWPIPTSVNWQFETGATIIDQSPDYALVRYDEPGTYNTTLQAQLAQCVSIYSQSLIILENPNPNSDGREGRGVIREFSIYPNPATEKLNAVIELHEAGRVLIELYHLNTNKRVLVKQLENEAYYKEELELNNLHAGIYVIVVKAGNEVKSVKVIKV